MDGVNERGVVVDKSVASRRANIMGNQEKVLRRSKALGMKTQMENLNGATEWEGRAHSVIATPVNSESKSNQVDSHWQISASPSRPRQAFSSQASS